MDAAGEEPQNNAPTVPLPVADVGTPQPSKLRDTLLGKARRCEEVEVKEQLFICVAAVTLLASVGFEIYELCTSHTRTPDFIFALVLLINALFCAYYVVHGVLQERATEVAIFSVAMFVVFICLVVSYVAGHKDYVKLGRVIVAAVLTPFLLGMGAWLSFRYHRSDHLIFRMVGGDRSDNLIFRMEGTNLQLCSSCRLLLAFFDLMKADLQLGISMVVLIVAKQYIDRGGVLLSVGIVFIITWFLLGYYSMKKEYRLGAFIFFLLCPVHVGYLIYRLVQVSGELSAIPEVAGSTIACGTIALIVRLLVMVVSRYVLGNFGRGLKEAFDD